MCNRSKSLYVDTNDTSINFQWVGPIPFSISQLLVVLSSLFSHVASA